MEKKFRNRRSEQPKMKDSSYLTILPVNNKRLSVSRASSKPSLRTSNKILSNPNKKRNKELPKSFLAVSERLFKTTFKTFDQHTLGNKPVPELPKDKEFSFVNSNTIDQRAFKSSRDTSIFSVQANNIIPNKQNMMYSISSFNSGVNKDVSTFRLKTNLKKLRNSYFETDTRSESRSSNFFCNFSVKTIKYKSGIRNEILVNNGTNVKLALCYLHKIFQICLCRAFSDMKHFNHSRQEYPVATTRRARIPRILSKYEKNMKKILVKPKLIKSLVRMLEEKSDTRMRLGYLKLKINRLRQNRKTINKMNPYITLSITLRQIIFSKMKDSFKKMKIQKTLGVVQFLKVNESTILPNMTSDQIEYYSDVSFPSIVNALNLAQQRQNGDMSIQNPKGSFPCPENIAGISPKGLSRFYVEHHETGYNGFSLSSFKASQSKKSLAVRERTLGVSSGLSRLQKIYKNNIYNAFR